MNNLFVILWMVFFHIVDDYYLQKGLLSSLKQKSWWDAELRRTLESRPHKYRHDYIMALIMHSISWSFMIMLPVAYIQQFDIGVAFLGVFIANVAVHAAVDHMKANMKIINLWQDQLLHMLQIAITAVLLFIGGV